MGEDTIPDQKIAEEVGAGVYYYCGQTKNIIRLLPYELQSRSTPAICSHSLLSRDGSPAKTKVAYKQLHQLFLLPKQALSPFSIPTISVCPDTRLFWPRHYFMNGRQN
jgi:hypothetical protein